MRFEWNQKWFRNKNYGFGTKIVHKNKKIGLGLGIFIGKTLLEKNLATVKINNSKTRSGAEINIVWKNSNLASL